MLISDNKLQTFHDQVQKHYLKHARKMPWRELDSAGSIDPYKILVSEFMLQQTQVVRVVPKFNIFMQQFPTLNDLAKAYLGDVLIAWQGLGYNRRAKFLHDTAVEVLDTYGGIVPNDAAVLTSFPGIGKNTAGAIRTYAFNEPTVFIETNIRTAYIHYFFDQGSVVEDSSIYELLERHIAMLPKISKYAPPGGIYREWYWALMDYGAYIKGKEGNASRRSKHYAVQSPFLGSKRQVRGAVLRELAKQPRPVKSLQKSINDIRLQEVLADLLAEGLIRKNPNETYSL